MLDIQESSDSVDWSSVAQYKLELYSNGDNAMYFTTVVR